MMLSVNKIATKALFSCHALLIQIFAPIEIAQKFTAFLLEI